MLDLSNTVQIKDVAQTYGKQDILKQIQLTIKKGELFGFLGPSGAGKTTLIKLIAGVEAPSKGEVFVFGEKMPQLKLMSRIGYMAQSDALYPELSALDNVYFFSALYGLEGKHAKTRANEVMELVGLSDHSQKKVAQYSGGMKRRLSLAISMMHQPELLLLDEPTVGIDPILRQSIWKELRRLASCGTTILITTHVMDEAEKCDRLGMIREGQLIATGTPEELMKQSNRNTIEGAFLAFGGASA